MDVDSVGYLAAALTTLSFFPQAIKTLRTDDTRSISLSMYSLFTSGVAIWAVFGLLSGNAPVLLANGFTLIPASFVLQKKIRNRLLGWEKPLDHWRAELDVKPAVGEAFGAEY